LYLHNKYIINICKIICVPLITERAWDISSETQKWAVPLYFAV